MPDVTPAYHYSLVLDAAANLLANSAAFQTLIGAGSASAAKALVWWAETDEAVGAQAALPRAIVDFQERRADTERTGTTTWTSTGPIILRIEYVTAQDTRQNAMKDALNKAGEIQEQIATLATGGGAYLDVTRITLSKCGRLSLPENNGVNAYVIEFTIHWMGTQL